MKQFYNSDTLLTNLVFATIIMNFHELNDILHLCI